MSVSAYAAHNVAYVQLGVANVGGRGNGQVIVSATVSLAGRGRGGAAGFELDVNGTPREHFFLLYCIMAGWFYLLGFISLLLAPFTGLTVWTAAAFFIIGYILEVS